MKRLLAAVVLLLAAVLLRMSWPESGSFAPDESHPVSSEPQPETGSSASGQSYPVPPSEPRREESPRTCRVNVRVVDGAGRPVAGIPVSITGRGPGMHREAPVGLRTDAGGRATVDVDPGPRSVSANFWRLDGARTDLWGDGRQFTAEAGAEVSFELVLIPCDASLAVQVVDDLGAPIPGADVVVSHFDLRAETDLQGRAFFARLPPVRHVRVDLQVADALRKSYAVPTHVSQHPTLKPGETAFSRFVLPRTGSLRVVFEPEEGIDPCEQVHVAIYSKGDYQQAPVWRRTSIEEGLSVDHLAPQEYQLTCEPTAEAGFSLGPMRLLRVPAGGTTEIRVVVRRHPGVVSGFVLDNLGQPVGGVYLWLVIGDYRRGELESRNTKSAADGSFRIAGVPQASIWLGVDPSGVEDRNFAHFGTFEESGLRLQGPMEGLRLELQPGYAIRGTVHRPSGRRVDRGTVYIDRKVFQGKGESRVEEGAFVFRNLRPGEYTIWYEGDDREKQAEQKVTVGPEAADATVDLVVRTRR